MSADRSLQPFLEALASEAPTPGGGGAAAVMGAIGAALLSMVCRLTIGRKDYAAAEAELRSVLARAEDVRARLAAMIDQDARAFDGVMSAYALPRGNDAEKQTRAAAIQAALREATRVPLACARACGEVLELSQAVAAQGNANVISDAGVAALAAHAALRSAALNVFINTGHIKDHGFVEAAHAELERLERGPGALEAGLYEVVRRRMR